MTRAIRIYAPGPPSVMHVEEISVGTPATAHVRMRQEAIGINFVDTMVRDGSFTVQLPTILGFEGAGVVEQLGKDVDTLSVGDRVGYFFSAGAYAGERLIDAGSLIRLPSDITTEQAAVFLSKGLTAWMCLRSLHALRPGEVVLVQGASGSVGSILMRWAKALGATVVGVAGSVDKLDSVKAGGTLALHSGDPRFLERVRDLAPNGVDVVYDFVGAATFGQSVATVRDGGTIVTIGAVSGAATPDPELLARRGIRIARGSTAQYVTSATVDRASGELFEAIRSGVFKDIVVVRYPLSEATRVHEDIAARRLGGIPILVP